ncbi:uncharacterized protein LTR77_007674 [Saxophila tyrrhenica]|uniref:Zf-C3HC-domain-containing protein n=1 Tax=Saxophila tyrrhenica TaxID=1690608 RepID=A0AAV9P5K1_9PEZI|nr:hypothetical protein LTR77_007674 [Saxophila tyrrhenica]
MPEEVALATTKRKFYKALDTFTTDSQVSLTPSTADTTTSSKRTLTPTEAFDEARARATKRLRHSVSSSSLPQKLDAIPTPASKRIDSTSNPREAPNYSPWSHETFLARLKTFSSVSLWHPKPEAINEVQWAKRGWRCVDVNTVACKGGCEKRVVVSLDHAKRATQDEDEEAEDDSEDEEAFEQALTERYKTIIVEGHAANCLWGQAGCKDDIYHLQVIRPSIWQPELKKRFQSTLKISAQIQGIKLRTIEKDETKVLPTHRLLKDLPPDIVPSANSVSSEPALTIALHGWRGAYEASNALLHCDACFQRIGLWMYQPGYRPRRHSSDAEDSEDTALIDLVEMHRDHCPWRNPASQRASGTFKGQNACQILHRVVSTFVKDYRRRSGQQGGTPQLQAEEADATPGGEQDDDEPPVLSKEEVARQDKERESRLRKIKNLFSIRRRTKSVPKAAIS